MVANSQTILVPIIDDADDEAEQETFTLTLSSAQGASLAQGGETLTVTGTITDDDDPSVTASFGQASYSVAEGEHGGGDGHPQRRPGAGGRPSC